MIVSLSIFFIFSKDEQNFLKDNTGDKVYSSEEKYFKDVRTEMDKRTSNNKEKNKIKIDYFSYIKIIIVLVLIIALIYVIFLFLKKSLKIKDDSVGGASVIISHSLGPGKWLQVVFVGGKYLILGVTNENINLLGEITDPKEIERYDIYLNQHKSEEGHSFSDVISNFFKAKFNKNINKEFDYEKDSIDFLKKQKDRLNNNNA